MIPLSQIIYIHIHEKKNVKKVPQLHINSDFSPPLDSRIRGNFLFPSFCWSVFSNFFYNNQVLIVYKMLDNSLQVLRALFTKMDKVRYPIFHHQHTYIIWFCLSFSYLILIQGEASWNSSKPDISKHIFVICHSSSG